MIERLGSEATSIPSISKSSSRDVDNVDLLLRWNEVVKVVFYLSYLLFSIRLHLMQLNSVRIEAQFAIILHTCICRKYMHFFCKIY